MSWLFLLALPFALLASRPGVSSSRRILAVTLVALVPFAGPVLAALVRRVRGGTIALEPVRPEPRLRPSSADVRRLGELPPVLERLLARDPAERLAALVHLSSAGDDAAMAVLQWTIEHGPPEVVLEAALTLEEIDVRRLSALVIPPMVVVELPTIAARPARVEVAAAETAWWPRWLRARIAGHALPSPA